MTWEGGALGGEGGRKEPAVREQLATQVGAHPRHPASCDLISSIFIIATQECGRAGGEQGGAQTSQKTWVLRVDQDGGSSGHLLGRRRKQVREKATGDLQTVFGKTFPQAFTRILKSKVL